MQDLNKVFEHYNDLVDENKIRERLRNSQLGPHTTVSAPAPKSPPNQSIANQDRSPVNRKAPAANLGEEQKSQWRAKLYQFCLANE